ANRFFVRPTTARRSARPPARRRARARNEKARRSFAGLRLMLTLPMPLLLQRIGDFLRHVAFVVFREHGVRDENARRVELPFRHHALSFAEEIGQQAAIYHRQIRAAVSHTEADVKPVLHDTSLLDQAAEPEARAGFDRLRRKLAWRHEEHDRIAQGRKREPCCDRKNDRGCSDKRKASLTAGHLAPFSRSIAARTAGR